jgi:hypothetical protein
MHDLFTERFYFLLRFLLLFVDVQVHVLLLEFLVQFDVLQHGLDYLVFLVYLVLHLPHLLAVVHLHPRTQALELFTQACRLLHLVLQLSPCDF